MNIHTSMHKFLGVALLVTTLTACGDNGSDDTTTTTPTNTTPPATSEPTTTTAPTTTDDSTTTTTTNPATTETTTNPSTDPTTTNPSTDPTTTTTDPDTTDTMGDPGFNFPDNPFEDYKQIDRHAAVEAGTAGIAGSAGLGFGPMQDITIRDAYNASNPEEDAAGMWVPEITKSVTFFHGALDDDIMAAGLTPATAMETLAQAGPVIVPDTIKYDPTKDTAYPNGRTLEDQVVDITLAAVLVKLGGNVPLSVLADLPLNPPKNDVDFKAEFPYLAPPHPVP